MTRLRRLAASLAFLAPTFLAPAFLAPALLTVSCTASRGSVGFVRLTVPDGINPALEVAIWYPATAQAGPIRVGLATDMLAPDAKLAGVNLPLVVLSHGNGGEFSGHRDIAEALAEAGFVVAAPTHTGDNYRDQSHATDIGGRVRQVSAVIDFMAHGWRLGAIDPARIGAFGFSAGGLTVLIAAGAQPDLARIGPHCAAHPAFFVCHLLAAHPAPAQVAGRMPPPFAHDARIRAIVVAAPALGFAFSAEGLRGVTAPVQLWRADDDAILPAPFYADAVRQALPAPPDFHPVPHAGHFDFLAPCPDALAAIAPPICTSEPGFDRTQLHRVFDREVVAFFTRTLGRP